MGYELVDQFLEATAKWGHKTGKGISPILILSFAHIGKIPSDKNDGQRDYRDDLISILKKSGISQAIYIVGLIKVVEIGLLQLATDYNIWRAETQDKIDFFKRMASDRDFYETVNRDLKEKGEQVFSAYENMGAIVDFHTKQLNDVDDNEPERHFALSTWRELTAPILEFENLWLIMKRDKESYF